jgi:chemotaxis protein methyltransferase CheR
MTVELDAGVLDRFRIVIADRLGLHFDESRRGFLAEVLRRRIEASGGDIETYLSRINTPNGRQERGALARELTVAETYFFRNIDQFRAFAEVVVPERLAANVARRRLRILSLGCASGEEVYSLAMVLRDTLTDPSWDVALLGVDLNAAMIEKARRGRYSAWALRETPERDRRRWFREDGREFVVDESLRRAVRFEEANLIETNPQLWQAAAYDVVFCRNVIMYFTPEQMQKVVSRVARALCVGGYLFLGHAETLRGISNDFHLCHTHGTFYYQRKELAAERPLPLASSRSDVPSFDLDVAVAPPEADAWFEAIRLASARVAALTDAREPNASGAIDAPPALRSPRWDLGLIFELLRKERFAEALAIIDALPPESGSDRDVLLLRAVLLAHSGQLEKAEETCRRLLEVDELNAGAHYLLALCREGAGDHAGASHHDQVAAYLDPGFAMPHLHLGLLARRAGDRESARTELGQALLLLQREDSSRVLLFGGGFGRDALLALCRTELVRCGGNA